MRDGVQQHQGGESQRMLENSQGSRMLEVHGLLRFEGNEGERVHEGRDAVDGEAVSDTQFNSKTRPEQGGFFI